MLASGEQNVIIAERDAALRALQRNQCESERRILGLEEDLRMVHQERDDAAGGSDAEFHAALARFQSQPMQRSDYTVAQNKALLTSWLRSRGFTTLAAQRRAIEAMLAARGAAG
jgi:hypothetical protein